MKLHWSPKSPYVRKVMVVAHETGIAPKLELVRSVAAMLKPNERLMRDNPLSKIPTLVLEDGSALFDSVVICEYLNDLAGGALFPQSGEAKWQALRWHALADGLIDTLILWRNERERTEMQCSAALMDAFELKTIAALHLASSIPNFFIQQIPSPASARDREMRKSILSEDVERVNGGFAALPNAPGWGVRINESALGRAI